MLSSLIKSILKARNRIAMHRASGVGSLSAIGLLLKELKMRWHLRSLAQKALSLYDLHVQKLSFLSYSQNAIFHVHSTEGDFALRIIPHPPPTPWQLLMELHWLEAIRSDLRIPFPVAVAGRDGALIHDLETNGHALRANVAMFTWVNGEPMGASPTPDRMHAIGRMIATLHKHSEGFHSSAPPTLSDWSEDELSFWIEQAENNPQEMSSEDHETVIRAALWAKSEYALIRPMLGMGMIHNDLSSSNIVLDRDGAVGAIDLEICRPGPFMQDVTLPLAYYQNHDNHADMETSLLDGYQKVRQLNNSELEAIPLFFVIGALRDLHHIFTWPRLSHRFWGQDVLRSSMDRLHLLKDHFKK